MLYVMYENMYMCLTLDWCKIQDTIYTRQIKRKVCHCRGNWGSRHF